MADPLIKVLNQRLADKISNLPSAPLPPTDGGKASFQDILQSKRSDALMDRLSAEIKQDGSSGQPKVLAADDIKVNFANSETQSSTGDPKNKAIDLFSKLNDDMVNMDSAIEILSDPNIKLNKRQLLAYQCGVTNMSLNVDLFSKLAQSVSQGLNQVLQTNIG